MEMTKVFNKLMTMKNVIDQDYVLKPECSIYLNKKYNKKRFFIIIFIFHNSI